MKVTTYITRNDDGTIALASEWPFPGSFPVDYAVECGMDGKLYKSGEEPQGPTIEEQRLSSLRIATEQRLAATDKYATIDYPDNALREKMLAYRTELRALNHQPGAPWDGGGEETPWPELPTV